MLANLKDWMQNLKRRASEPIKKPINLGAPYSLFFLLGFACKNLLYR